MNWSCVERHLGTSALYALVAPLLFMAAPPVAWAGSGAGFDRLEIDYSCEEIAAASKVAWLGDRSRLSFSEVAALCGPVLWFSPDEPLLEGRVGADIRIPTAFPFQPVPDAPVVYYRIREVYLRPEVESDATVISSGASRGDWMLDLSGVAGVQLDYFFYYPREVGLGGHRHDVESAQFKLAVFHNRGESACPFGISVEKVVGKAHGVLWYDNTLEADLETRIPMHILVEEGKHASCTDKNADGYFTPSYDVNVRVNDAWGVRDIIRSGTLFTGSFATWMAKVRRPEHRVYPPLPDDSPRRRVYETDGFYQPDGAIYELRELPRPEEAATDPGLVPFIDDKGDPDWPDVIDASDFKAIVSWTQDNSFVKSLTVAGRMDEDLGVSLVFPLFIVRMFEDPMAGGFLMNRVYLKDRRLRDIGWNLLYTPSASRWVDGYGAFGCEWDDDGTRTKARFMVETGMKLRVNLTHSPFRFLTTLGTDFWGLRVGVKTLDYAPVSHVGYAVELGAGSF